MPKNALTIALRYLKFRPRSVFEVEQKLKTKSVSDKETKSVIDVLKKNKLLDDKEFAKMWIRDRNLLKPTGLYLLKIELRRFGIADDDIDNALKEQNEEELARKALEMKYRDREIDFQKKAAFLQRRGFRTNIIYKVLRKEN